MTRKLCLTLSLFLFLAAACDGPSEGRWWTKLPGYGDYWWQRGQPRSTAQLYDHAGEKLKTNLQSFRSQRPDVAAAAEAVQQQLGAAFAALGSNGGADVISSALGKTEQDWMGLEGKLSVGSRAAYGELAGELRMFNEQLQAGQNPHEEAFREALTLYAARVLSFLANEISVPAPVLL